MIKCRANNHAYLVSFRVYAEDTDMMGIVYHANYLRFFERARTEMLRNNGLSLTMMAEHGTHFAIHNAQICYNSPARLDDIVTIETSYEMVRATSLEFRQKMFNQSQTKLSEAIIQVVCVNNDLKPKRLPKEFIGGVKSGQSC